MEDRVFIRPSRMKFNAHHYYEKQNKVKTESQIRPQHHIPPGNEWAAAIENIHRQDSRPNQVIELMRRRRRIIPTLYSWDPFRVYLNVIRVYSTYEAVKRIVLENAPSSSQDLLVLSVLENTDIIQKLRPEHLAIEENIFLLCVPARFIICVSTENSKVSDFYVTISPIHDVFELKRVIYESRGFPMERMELVHGGRCMENEERLLHYNVRHEDYVRMYLQVGIRVAIKIIAFWQKVYNLDVDITCTASEVIFLVLKMCCTSDVGEYMLKENYLLPRFLLLCTASQKPIDYNQCIHGYIEEENVSHLLIQTRYNPISDCTVRVKGLPSQREENVKVHNGGKYGAIYLALHGLSDVPLNRFNLIGLGRTLNPYDVVNVEKDGVELQLHITKTDAVHRNDMFEVRIVTPASCVLPMSLPRHTDIEEVKAYINTFGFQHAADYKLWYGNKELNDSQELYFTGILNRDFIHMVLTYFPVYLVTKHGEKEEIQLHSRGTLRPMLEVAENLDDSHPRKPFYLFCGERLSRETSVEDVGLKPRNLIFRDHIETEVAMECVLTDNGKTSQFLLYRNSTSFRIREQLEDWNLPRHVMDSLEYLLMWRLTKPSATESIRFVEALVTEAYYSTNKTATNDTFLDGSSSKTEVQLGRNYSKLQSNVTKKSRFTPLDGSLLSRAKVRRSIYSIESQYKQIYKAESEMNSQMKTITLPPMKLYSKPISLNYDTEEGLDTLLYLTEKK